MIMKQGLQNVAIMLCAMLLIGVSTISTAHALAADGNDTCTNFAALYNEANSQSDGSPQAPGLLTNITEYIKGIINPASQKLYEAFTNSDAYRNAVGATITLMVVIFGVGFLIGVVQASFGQVLIRLVKVGIILTMISPTGWQFFSAYAVKFFNDGTDQIIATVLQIGTGVDLVAGESPFKLLDGLAKVILSPDMIIAILASTFAGGPYGVLMGGLLAFGVVGLVQMLIKGLQAYALSFVVRSLMLGVAPLFIVFLLFDKTKQLFSGWLNVLVFLTLHPILYFTFISFFLVMLTSSMNNMMGGSELCWTEYKSVQGSQNKVAFWRFKPKDASYAQVDTFDWGGAVSCRLNGGTNCPEFPINIVDILSFLILVYVARNFSEVTRNIASEISNSFVNLDQQAKTDLSKLNSQQPAAAANRPAGGQATRAGPP